MRRILIIAGIAFATGLLAVFSYAAGHSDGRKTAKKQVYLEIATTGLLSALAPGAQPQLREYAKAQFYYYSHFHSPQIYEDLGPVDVSLLNGLEPFIRHGDSPNDYYRKR